MDEETGHHLGVEGVSTFRAANHRSNGNALFVPQQIFDEVGFTSVALSNEKDGGVIGNATHIKLS